MVTNSSYQLDLDNECLWCNDQEIRLRPKLFLVLRFLVEHPHRLLTLQEIMDGIWSDTYVTMGLVKTYIRDLRRLLQDDPKTPCYIETRHGRGYRFIGDIEIKQNAAPSAYDRFHF